MNTINPDVIIILHIRMMQESDQVADPGGDYPDPTVKENGIRIWPYKKNEFVSDVMKYILIIFLSRNVFCVTILYKYYYASIPKLKPDPDQIFF